MNERKPFIEIIQATSTKLKSELETYPRRFVTHMLHNPRDAVLYSAIVATSLYAFVFQEGAETQRNWFFPVLAKAAVISLAISVPISLWLTHHNRPQPHQ